MFGNHPSTNIKNFFLKLYCLLDVTIFNVLGIHSIFDLVSKRIPTGSFYTLFNCLRYSVSGLVLCISMYHRHESMQLKLDETAEKVFEKAREVIMTIEEIIAQDSQLLNEGGYGFDVKQETLHIAMHEDLTREHNI